MAMGDKLSAVQIMTNRVNLPANQQEAKRRRAEPEEGNSKESRTYQASSQSICHVTSYRLL